MSLGKDLATIRNDLGFSLDEIQSQIKIPTHTLKTIEDDSIFDDEQNKTYIRSFIRSYAKALKIEDTIIVNALDSVEAKIYNPGDLLKDLNLTSTNPIFNPSALENATELDEESDSKVSEVETPVTVSVESNIEEPPTVENVNWADLGRKFENNEKGPRIWLASIIAFSIIILIVLGIVFRSSIMDLFSSSEEETTLQEEVINTLPPPILLPADSDSSNLDTPNPLDEEVQEETVPEVNNSIPDDSYFISQSALSDTITVSIYAAFDKLEPVRVTSDINWRTNPFWMEQGEAFNFDFVDSLVIRGQYSRMLLLFNGHVIDNPTNQYFDSELNSLVLTRDLFDSPAFLSTPPEAFEYEVGLPDSIVYRINY